MTTNGDSAIPYASLSALRDAHTQLLKSTRKVEGEKAFAEIEAFLRQAKATGCLLDSENDRTLSQSLMDYWVTVLYRAKRNPPEATLNEFDPLLAPSLADDLCPYVGLNSFEEQNNEAFFGRQALIEEMVSIIRENRLLYVVGPSGSGKSSLVFAGLVPKIKNGALPGSENWRCFQRMVPGVNPLRSLALTIAAFEARDTEWVSKQVQELGSNPNHLRDLLSVVDVPTVLVIDQFEELFTLCQDDNLRQVFVHNLINATREPAAPCTLILTMRADFETQIVRFPELMSLAETGQVRVTPLTAADLHAAIQQPASRIGLKFEDGIVEELVRDILGEAAGLPLLQFALLSLWKTRDRNRITWTAFRKLGSARLALGRAADEFFSNLIVEDQWAAKGIFLRLVRPGELTHEFTSNRVNREALYSGGVARDRIDRVLEKLISAGLVKLTKCDVPLRDQVEVAHEALVRNWNTLADWLDEERIKLRQRIRLTTAAEQWLEHGKDHGGLLRGVLLQEAHNYTDRNEAEEEFVRASQAAVDQEQREKEEAVERERQLDHERTMALHQRAEESARHARRTRRFAFVLGLAAVFAICFAVLAAAQRRQAAKQAWLATARRFEAESAKTQADSERKQADSARSQAEFARTQAEIAQAEADAARKEAESNFKQAKRAEKQALAAQRIALEQKSEIARLLALTEEGKQRALEFAEYKQKQLDELNAKILQENEERNARDELNNTSIMVLRTSKLSEEELRGAVKKLAGVRQTFQKYDRRSGEEDTLNVLTTVYRKLNDQENVQKTYNEAVKMYSDDIKTVATDPSRSRQAAGRLGDFYRGQGEHPKAVQLYTEALTNAETKLLNIDSDIENFTTNATYKYYFKKLEEIYRDQAKYRDLEALYRHSFEVKKKILKPNSYALYVALNELGNFYREQRRYVEAEPCIKEALDSARALGAAEVFASLRNLAAVYRDQGKYGDALPLYRQALEILENSSKKENTDLLIESLSDLASIYHKQKDYGEAERSYQRLLDLFQAQPEKFQKRLNSTKASLADLYLVQRRFSESERLYKELAENLEKDAKNGDNPDLAAVRSALGNIYRNFKKNDDAARQYEEALKIYGNSNSYRSQVAAININLALLNDNQGNRPRGHEFYKKARALSTSQALVRIFAEQRDYEAVRSIYDHELEHRKTTYGPESFAIYETLTHAGRLFKEQKEYAESERYYAEALKLIRKLHGPNDTTHLVTSLNNLAKVYILQKKNDQAERLYKQALTNLEKDPKLVEPRRTVETLENYAQLLEDTGRSEEASKLKQRAKVIRGRRLEVEG